MLGRAGLGIWMDIVPDVEADFDRWYREQHFPERLGVRGFLRGRRYLAIRGAPKYFIVYETEAGEVLRSPAYMARLNNPTDWTRRVLPNMRNVLRNAYRLVSSVGDETGQTVVTLRIDPVPGREGELRDRYDREALQELARIPGVLSASLFEMEQVATGVITEERKLVGAVGTAPPFLCLCELREPAVVDQSAWKTLLAPGGLARREVVSDVAEGVYRLLHSLSHSPA